MPLYELFCIARHIPDNFTPIKNLVTTCATLVMDSGGVVRKIHSFGDRALPQPKTITTQVDSKVTKVKIHSGDYWLMHFDANPTSMHALGRRLRKETLVLRWTITKLGEKIEDNFSKKAKTLSFFESIDSAAARSSFKNPKV